MGIAELRPALGVRVDAAHYLKEPTYVSKKGKVWAAIVPREWVDELMELRAERAARSAQPQEGRPGQEG